MPSESQVPYGAKTKRVSSPKSTLKQGTESRVGSKRMASDDDNDDEHADRADGAAAGGDGDADDVLANGARHERAVLPTTPPPTTLRDEQGGGRDVVVDADLMRALYLSSNESMLKVSALHAKGGALNCVRFIAKSTGPGRSDERGRWHSPVRNALAIAYSDKPRILSSMNWTSFDANPMAVVYGDGPVPRALALDGSAADGFLNFDAPGAGGHFGAGGGSTTRTPTRA